MKDLITYVKLCRDTFCEAISTFNLKDFESEKKPADEMRQKLQTDLSRKKKQLKILFSQKTHDLAGATGNETLITESYDLLQEEILAQIHGLELQLKTFEATAAESSILKEKPPNALAVADQIVAGGVLDRKDIEILIKHIEIDQNGHPDIEFKYRFSDRICCIPSRVLNHHENKIIYHTLKLIKEETRGFTSAKYISAKLTLLGYSKSPKSVLPYLNLMLYMGVLEKSGYPRRPYTIIKSAEEIQALMDDYAPNLHGYGVNRRHAGDGI